MEIPGLPIYCIRIIFSIQLTVVYLQQRSNMLQQCYSKIYGSVKECRMNFHVNDAEMCGMKLFFFSEHSVVSNTFLLLLFVESNYFMRWRERVRKNALQFFLLCNFPWHFFQWEKSAIFTHAHKCGYVAAIVPNNNFFRSLYEMRSWRWHTHAVHLAYFIVKRLSIVRLKESTFHFEMAELRRQVFNCFRCENVTQFTHFSGILEVFISLEFETH